MLGLGVRKGGMVLCLCELCVGCHLYYLGSYVLFCRPPLVGFQLYYL